MTANGQLLRFRLLVYQFVSISTNLHSSVICYKYCLAASLLTTS